MEVNRAMLLPAIALAAWTFVMWTWMYATRIPAMLKMKMKLDGDAPRGEQMATGCSANEWVSSHAASHMARLDRFI
jgi:hypothetical protein